MKEKQEAQQLSASSMMDTTGVLQVRLDSTIILERVQRLITGVMRQIVYGEDGKPYFKEEKVSEPKANKDGIHWIINYVENVINSQAVQGNFDFDQYQLYIAEVHEGLIYNLENNLHKWGIAEDDYEPIIDIIMNLVIPFFSRLVDNKERESYAQSIQVRETSNVTSSGGLFK